MTNMMNNTFATSSVLALDAPVDIITEKPIVYPTWQSIIAPNYPDYIGGQRISTNHFGTKDLKDFNGGPDDLIKAIGADFKAVPSSHYYMNGVTGELTEAADRVLINSKTGEQIGKNLISDRYTVLDFDDGVYYFWALLEEIAKHGYQVEPAVAKIYGYGGAKMFLQYRIFGADIMGEPVDTYLTLLTSHDKSLGFTIALSMVRLFCQNQVHRLLKNAEQKRVIKHLKTGKEKIQLEANRIIQLCESKHKALDEYLTGLANIKVNNEMIFNAMAETRGLYQLDSQTRVNKFTTAMEQLMACYNMPDLNDWRGTALGAYYAYSDFQDHVVPARKMKSESYLERAIDGNVGLGQFADVLVEMAK